MRSIGGQPDGGQSRRDHPGGQVRQAVVPSCGYKTCAVARDGAEERDDEKGQYPAQGKSRPVRRLERADKGQARYPYWWRPKLAWAPRSERLRHAASPKEMGTMAKVRVSLNHHRVGHRRVAVDGGGGDDRRSVVDGGAGPEAKGVLGQAEEVPEAGKAKHSHDIERENRGDGVADISLVRPNNGVCGGDGGSPTYGRTHSNEDVEIPAQAKRGARPTTPCRGQ